MLAGIFIIISPTQPVAIRSLIPLIKKRCLHSSHVVLTFLSVPNYSQTGCLTALLVQCSPSSMPLLTILSPSTISMAPTSVPTARLTFLLILRDMAHRCSLCTSAMQWMPPIPGIKFRIGWNFSTPYCMPSLSSPHFRHAFFTQSQ